MTTISLILLLAAGDAGRLPLCSGQAGRLTVAVVARSRTLRQAKDFQARFTQKYSRQVMGA